MPDLNDTEENELREAIAKAIDRRKVVDAKDAEIERLKAEVLMYRQHKAKLIGKLFRLRMTDNAEIERLTMERDAQYDLNVSMVAKHAAQEDKIERLEDTLADIEIYTTDTLSGPLSGTDDLEWYRDGVVEIIKRVQAALAGKEDI